MGPPPGDTTPTISRTLLNRRMLICIVTGFSSGLPFFVILQMVPGWLADEGVDIATIGLFAWTGIPYAWKFLWAPAMDRYVPPFLGRRRGWALLTQAALLILIACFGTMDPRESVTGIAALCLAVSFASASQDIVLDGYRRELLPDLELGLGNAYFVNAYRAAGMVPGGLAFILADQLPWSAVHAIVASCMLVGLFASFVIDEPELVGPPPPTLRAAIVDPLRELLGRNGLAHAALIIAFLFFYKLGDSMATALATPFYLAVGFTKTEVGAIAKLVSFWAALVGIFGGGVIMLRIGINRALWLFGLVQITSILGFAALSEIGPNRWALGLVVLFEYLGVGLGTAAFVAFMARATDRRFSAFQFALLSSFMALPRTAASAMTGYIVAAAGWTNFFLICTAVAIPGMLLLPLVAPWTSPSDGATGRAAP